MMRAQARAGSAGTRPLRWLAAGCACALVAVLALEYHFGATREMRLAYQPSHAVPIPVWAAPSSAEDASPSPPRVQEWTRVVLARPLFSASRRPASVVVAGPQEPRLAGIVVGPSGRRAIFAGADGARGTIAGIGQQAGGWRVQAIDATSVQVIGPAGLRTLRPARDTGAHVEDGGGMPLMSAHPSILDLLRGRSMQLGPGSMPIPSLPPMLQPPAGGPTP